ncbi:hypothetical protein Z969_07705, partial [Clostridium novyi A str. 4570]
KAYSYSTDNWKNITYNNRVPLDKSFTVQFNRNFKVTEIDGIVVQDQLTQEFFPVLVSFPKASSLDEVKITPINRYKNDYKYSLRIFLNNGDRYKMNFKTQNQYSLRYVSFYDFQYGRGNYSDTRDVFYHGSSLKIRQKELKEDFLGDDTYCHYDTSYLLDNKYRRLKGYYGATDNNNASEKSIMKIYGDGKELLSKEVKRGQKLQYFDIDVSEVDELRFEGDPCTVFYNLQLGYDKDVKLDLVPQN